MNSRLKTMYNSDIPSRAELPSTRQLIRSTIIAAVSAVVLLYTVVLPSEYGLDPTGIGKMLGLTEMGEIKTRLAKEAAEDALATKASLSQPQDLAVQTAGAGAAAAAAPAPPAEAQRPQARPAPESGHRWRDEMTFKLAPGQGTEIKLKMKEGEKALFSWIVEGGVVNFDTHGDALGRSISYEKGRSFASDQGELVAAFSGHHGWFWRNRGQADVTVVLKTGGDYSDIKRLK
jgi:hypothetical protein